jgi:hypothetical protein
MMHLETLLHTKKTADATNATKCSNVPGPFLVNATILVGAKPGTKGGECDPCGTMTI